MKSRTNRPLALDRMSRFRWSIAGAREKGICSSSELRERMSMMRRRPEPPALSARNSGLKVAPQSRGRLLRITPARSMRSSCRVAHGPSSWEGLIWFGRKTSCVRRGVEEEGRKGSLYPSSTIRRARADASEWRTVWAQRQTWARRRRAPT